MGGKKIKGRKRHITTDTEGNLLHIEVHKANEHDSIAGCRVLEKTHKKFRSITGFCGDAGYRGTAKKHVEEVLNLAFDISKKIKESFVILAKRWIVERCFAWANNARRLSKDYEINTRTSENMFRISMIRISLAQMAKDS